MTKEARVNQTQGSVVSINHHPRRVERDCDLIQHTTCGVCDDVAQIVSLQAALHDSYGDKDEGAAADTNLGVMNPCGEG